MAYTTEQLTKIAINGLNRATELGIKPPSTTKMTLSLVPKGYVGPTCLTAIYINGEQTSNLFLEMPGTYNSGHGRSDIKGPIAVPDYIPKGQEVDQSDHPVHIAASKFLGFEKVNEIHFGGNTFGHYGSQDLSGIPKFNIHKMIRETQKELPNGDEQDTTTVNKKLYEEKLKNVINKVIEEVQKNIDNNANFDDLTNSADTIKKMQKTNQDFEKLFGTQKINQASKESFENLVKTRLLAKKNAQPYNYTKKEGHMTKDDANSKAYVDSATNRIDEYIKNHGKLDASKPTTVSLISKDYVGETCKIALYDHGTEPEKGANSSYILIEVPGKYVDNIAAPYYIRKGGEVNDLENPLHLKILELFGLKPENKSSGEARYTFGGDTFFSRNNNIIEISGIKKSQQEFNKIQEEFKAQQDKKQEGKKFDNKESKEASNQGQQDVKVADKISDQKLNSFKNSDATYDPSKSYTSVHTNTNENFFEDKVISGDGENLGKHN